MKKRKLRYTVLCLAVLFQMLLTGCAASDTQRQSDQLSKEPQESISSDGSENEETMRMIVRSENAQVIFELNDSSASKSFFGQLPLTVSVENYSTNEKTFHPAQKLDISNVREGDCPAGSIAYFSPWNTVAMYYGDAPVYEGLYPMGVAVEGAEKIGELAGSITVTADT